VEGRCDMRTDTERLDFLERDAGRTVYPHDSFGGKEWAFTHYAFTSLRTAVDAAMDHADCMGALAADPQLPHREYAERRAESSMVTILPIDIDQDLIREGRQYALAERFRERVKRIEGELAEMRVGNLLDREAWDKAFAALAELHDQAKPILEYAEAFLDQYPGDGEDAAWHGWPWRRS